MFLDFTSFIAFILLYLMYLLRSKITYYRSGDFVSCPIDRGIIDVKKVWPSFSSVAEVYRPGW